MPRFDPWFAVPAIVGVSLALVRSGQFMTAMYSLKRFSHGIRHVISIVFGFGGISITVRNGEIDRPSPGKDGIEPDEAAIRIGGPGKISIKMDSAAFLERGSGFSRAVGPGDHRLSAFERVRSVFDLRTQSLTDDRPEWVLTRDGIPVRARASTVFRLFDHIEGDVDLEPPRPTQSFIRVIQDRLIEPFMTDIHALWRRLLRHPAPAAQAAPIRPRRVSTEVLRRAVYELPAGVPWARAAHGAVSGQVREAFASRLLDQLFAPDRLEMRPRQEIADRVFVDSRRNLAQRGVDLIGLHFDNIVVPTEVVEQRRRTWEVNWKRESTIIEAGGEAESLLAYQNARADAQAELLQAVTQAIRTLDQTADRSELAHPLALRFMDVIARQVDSTLRDSSKSTISSSDVEKLIKQIRQVLAQDKDELG